MLTNNGKYYLYRHIRLDKNEPFYIGVGQKEGVNRQKVSSEYRRAFVKTTRNNLWKSIANKTKYEVEILLESDSKEFISQKEKEFIAIYGRRDIGSGVLCNMTDGGDYYPIIEIGNDVVHGRNKMSKKRRKDVFAKLKRPLLGTNPKRVFVYDKITGVFIKQFNQIKEAANSLFLNESTLCTRIKKRESISDYIATSEYIGEVCNTSLFIVHIKTPVLKICPFTFEVLEKFKTKILAANSCNAFVGNIGAAIKSGVRFRGYYWKYDDGMPFKHSGKRLSDQPVVQVCPKTNTVIAEYNSFKEAAEMNGFKSKSSIRTSACDGVIRYGFYWRKKQ